MCGLAYVYRLDNKPAFKQLLKRYDKQKDRGTEGYGYIAIKQSGNVSKVARFQFEHEMKKSLEATKYHQVLLHHRYPTSTPNVPEATHPIFVSHEELTHDYYVTHNGVIKNEDDLKDEHEKLGYKYTTEIYTMYKPRLSRKVYHDRPLFNDSEAFAIELARTIEGKQPMVKATGAQAYIAIQCDKRGHAKAVYYGTNGGNTLVLDRSKDSIVIASEGHGTDVPEHKAQRLDLGTFEVSEVESIKLEGHKKAIGFAPYSYSGYDGSSAAYYKGGNKRDHKHSPTAEESMTMYELEGALEEINNDVLMAQEEGLEAMSAGDAEEEDMWKYELKGLEERRKRLEGLLERKAYQLND